MKVAVISKSNRYAGGASKVAEELSLWLNEIGHTAQNFIAFPDKNLAYFQRSLYGNRFNLILSNQIHGFTGRLGFRELIPVEYWCNLKQVVNEYDVVHFHDLFTAISPITLALVARHRPTFFTVHDCSAFTGGCLYPMGCDKFISYCHQCPQLDQSSWKHRIRDRTREIQAIKRYITKQFDIKYIFPSNWISQQAKLTLEFKTPSVVIPNGIDLKYYVFDDKKEAKYSLGIDVNRQVILISALSLKDYRKGVGYAVAAIQSVADINPVVILVGKPNEELIKSLDGLDVIDIGFVTDSNLKANVYSAADIMLFCSLADNLPLTILEAMAASVVVIGFSTGGVPDMINSGVNGVLVESKNQEALNHALRQTMLSGELGKLSRQARLDVENNFSKSIFLEKHLNAYQEAMTGFAKPKK